MVHHTLGLQVFAKSRLRTDGVVGEALLEALGGGGAAWARKKRVEAGVPPPPDLEHVSKAPGDQHRCRALGCGTCTATFTSSWALDVSITIFLSVVRCKSAQSCYEGPQFADERLFVADESYVCRRFYQDDSYAPATREAFDQQLAAFYESHGAVQASLSAPQPAVFLTSYRFWSSHLRS